MLTASLPNRNARNRHCGQFLFLPVCLYFFCLPIPTGRGCQSEWPSDETRSLRPADESIRLKETAWAAPAALDASLLASLVRQNQKPLDTEALRILQRTFRTVPSETSRGNSLQEILRITNGLRLHDENVRYAELGVNCRLTDEKIALGTAVRLTDARKYSAAAEYYRQWLHLKSPSPDRYLRTLVKMEMGRLQYLAGEFEQAQSAFQTVLRNLNDKDLPATQREQLLRNSDTIYRMMANTFLKTGNFELAKTMLTQIKIDQVSPVQYLFEAQFAMAQGQTDSAKEWVMRFLAKQPNNSEAFQLLRTIISRQLPDQPDRANEAYTRELEFIRKKFRTGKVLDEILVAQYLDAGTTDKAKDILLRQRNDSLWRDRANRLLLEISLREQNLGDLVKALAIEVDEHQSLVEIREDLLDHRPQIQEWSKELVSRLQQAASLPIRISCICLLNLLPRKNDSGPWHLATAVEALKRDIISDADATGDRKLQRLTLLGREFLRQQKFAQSLVCFEACLELNRAPDKTWRDKKVAFDAFLTCALCQNGLDNRKEAFANLQQAGSIVRFSPSQMHMTAWIHLQFAELNSAVVAYSKFLIRFDKGGTSGSLGRLTERVRLELAFTFFLLNKTTLAREILNEARDRNPLGPDLDALSLSNQKYREEKKLFIEFANGVKNGGALPLGRN